MKLRQLKLFSIISLGAIFLHGCSGAEAIPFLTDYSKTENVGTIAGTALGALAGDMASDGIHGKNKTRAVVGGAAIGMITGHVLAKYADERHQDSRELKKKEMDIKYPKLHKNKLNTQQKEDTITE